MRILRVITSLDPRMGGVAAAARLMDEELIRRGHTVEVICLDNNLKSFDSYPAVVHTLAAVTGYRFSWGMVGWVRANVHRFDAIVVDGLWQFHGFAIWAALRGRNKPYFVFPHGMLDPWFKRQYPLKHLKKWLYWHCVEYWVLSRARRVVFTCATEMLEAAKTFSRYCVKPAIVTLGTANPSLDFATAIESLYKKYPAIRGKKVLLFLGRIHAKKGCDLLLEAFAECSRGREDVHLMMVGPSETGFRGDLERRAVQLGIASSVTWVGMASGEEKWALFRAADFMCLPSHQENFGVVVAEALSCGTPVLISDKVNIWREVVAAGAGLAQPDTLAGTKNLLNDWLRLPGSTRAEMSVAAKKCYQDLFSIGGSVDQLMKELTAACR